MAYDTNGIRHVLSTCVNLCDGNAEGGAILGPPCSDAKGFTRALAACPARSQGAAAAWSHRRVYVTVYRFVLQLTLLSRSSAGIFSENLWAGLREGLPAGQAGVRRHVLALPAAATDAECAT